MCNLYTLDPALIGLAEDFEKFLGLKLVLSAGPDTLANQPWAKVVYPKYQGLFAAASSPPPASASGPARRAPRPGT